MSEFKVEKGVPVPLVNKNRPSRYPFFEMEIGDSFIVPTEKVVSVKTYASHIKHHHKKRDGRGYTIRQDDTGQYRCWRVK